MERRRGAIERQRGKKEREDGAMGWQGGEKRLLEGAGCSEGCQAGRLCRVSTAKKRLLE